MRFPKVLYIVLSAGLGGYLTHRQVRRSNGTSPYPYMKDRTYGYVGSLCGSAASELNTHFGPSIVDKNQTKLTIGTAEPIAEKNEKNEKHESDDSSTKDHESAEEQTEATETPVHKVCPDPINPDEEDINAFYKKMGIVLDEDEEHANEFDNYFLQRLLQRNDHQQDLKMHVETCKSESVEDIEKHQEPCRVVHQSEPSKQETHESEPKKEKTHESEPRKEETHKSEPRKEETHKSEPRKEEIHESKPCEEVCRIIPPSHVSEPLIEAPKVVHEDKTVHKSEQDDKAHLVRGSIEISNKERSVKGIVEVCAKETTRSVATQVDDNDDDDDDDDDDEDDEESASTESEQIEYVPVAPAWGSGVPDPTKAISINDPCVVTRTKVLYDGYVSYLDTRTRTTCLTYQTIDCSNLAKSKHSHCECIRFCCRPPPGLVFGNKDNCERAEVLELLLPTTSDSGGKQICKYCMQSGFWKIFNNYIAFLLQTYKKVEVCSGTLHLGGQGNATGKLPTHFFKVLVCENQDHTFRFECYKIEDILMQKDLPALKCFLTTRRELEAQSGFKIFDKVSDAKIRYIETDPNFK